MILVPIDSSERTERVVKFAIDEAKVRKDKILLVHFVEPIPAHIVVEETLKEVALKKGEELLKNFAAKIREEGVECEVKLVKDKKADIGIVELASKLKLDLIVIGVRKRSPTGKVLFGSVAQHVILNAEQPILCVK